jgi:hypothetical protein
MIVCSFMSIAMQFSPTLWRSAMRKCALSATLQRWCNAGALRREAALCLGFGGIATLQR